MPMPRVNDRIKEIPAQTLRAVFAGIGQMLLVADKLRARAAEQISGTGAAPATRPADDAPRPADTSAPAAAAPAPETKPGTSRWRSLDETGNVRLLGEGEEEEDLLSGDEPQSTTAPEAAPAAEPAPAAPPEPASAAEPPPAAPPEPATPPQPAAAAEPAAAADTAASPEPAAPKEPAAPPEPAAESEPAAPPEPTAESEPAAAAPPAATELPVANYDQLSIASLRARLRTLDTSQVTVLLDYEKAHQGRPAVVTMFERRIVKLTESS